MRLAFGWVALVGLASVAGAGLDRRGLEFHAWREFSDWSRGFDAQGETVLISPVLTPNIAVDEVVASWNVDAPEGTGIGVGVRALYPGRSSTFYHWGYWTALPGSRARMSVNGQSDADGEMRTDTLSFKQPARRLQVRLEIHGARGVEPRVRWLGLSLLDRRGSHPPLEPNRKAWGREIAIPERSQQDFPGGEQAWCSPTSVSMVLAHWAQVGRHAAWDRDVLEVVAGVMDPAWPGTGNWSFNVAFAGSLPGLRAYVTRLGDFREIEDWTLAGFPVIASLDYDRLRGIASTRSSGHLVVVRGFTGAGDVVINDPGISKPVRRVFARGDFVAAWRASRNTVYLIYPEGMVAPASPSRHWFTEPNPAGLRPGERYW